MAIRTVLLILCAALCLGQEASITGKWAYTMDTPNGDVPVLMDLKADGTRLTGTVSAGGERTFPIENGTAAGNSVKFTFKRGRPQGGSMTYEVSGTVTGNLMKGSTTADVDGQKVTQEWEAKRQ